MFCRDKTTLLNMKDVLRYPKLADTMETIAEHGAEAFYTGKIARDLISDIKAVGMWKKNCSTSFRNNILSLQQGLNDFTIILRHIHVYIYKSFCRIMNNIHI